MIEINLLPGARKQKQSTGASLDVKAMFSGAMARITDPFLIIAVVGVVLGVGATAIQYVLLGRTERAVTERNEKAKADSLRFAVVLAERMAAESQRDSVIRQFAIIRAIDGERFTWAHVLDELSRTLPQYTWIVRVNQTSPVLSVAARDSVMPDTSAAARKRPHKTRDAEEFADSLKGTIPRLQLRLVGQTVDVQAMTTYMRLLEASPFIENVAFVGSDIKAADGRDVREFTIDMQFQIPAPSAIRTVPLTVAVR